MLPICPDDYVNEDNAARVMDAFVDEWTWANSASSWRGRHWRGPQATWGRCLSSTSIWLLSVGWRRVGGYSARGAYLRGDMAHGKLARDHKTYRQNPQAMARRSKVRGRTSWCFAASSVYYLGGGAGMKASRCCLTAATSGREIAACEGLRDAVVPKAPIANANAKDRVGEHDFTMWPTSTITAAWQAP